jgi:disulfide bond formation protein DsbB
MPFPSYRTFTLLAALAAVMLLLVAYYLECVLSILPCSLCILQRGVYILLVIAFLLAAWQGVRRSLPYGLLTLFISALGIFLAGRQVWLQSLPKAPAEVCLPGFSYMVSHLPLSTAFKLMLLGSDNCGVVTWRLLGWSIAQWSLLCFVLFALAGVGQIIYRYAKPKLPQK